MKDDWLNGITLNLYIMKKSGIFVPLLVVVFSMPLSMANAQGRHHHGNKQWKHQKNVIKRTDKLNKEQAKRYAKLRHEQAKRIVKFNHDRYKHNGKHGKKYWAEAHRYHYDHPVFFRDYRTFYDPYRSGYVYRVDDRWRFSPDIPAFLADIDLRRARVQIMADIPLSGRPEYYYDDYSRRYPPAAGIHIGLSL